MKRQRKSFNRTRMELKHLLILREGMVNGLLTVPEWN